MIHRFALMALLGWFAVVQTAHSEDSGFEPDWFQIEIIVLKQLYPDAALSEIWPLSRENPAPQVWNNVTPGRAITDRQVALLPDDELKLRDEFLRLRRSRDYRPLLHWGWRQQVQSREQALPLKVVGGDMAGNRYEVEGFLTFSLSRFLHVDTDLVFRRFEQIDALPLTGFLLGPQDNHTLSLFGLADTERADGSDDTIDYATLLAAPMRQTRRMRSRELHYIDHPLFALLVYIEPYDKPVEVRPLQPIEPLQNDGSNAVSVEDAPIIDLTVPLPDEPEQAQPAGL